ncbi:MAG: hypothetical protein ABSG51_04290 [Terracidiphilus sp.]|jgi:hypothetical protein
MRRGLIFVSLFAFCALLVAQQTLNNASVIKLAKAGLSDDLIVSTINASPGTYDTSADGLIALKTAGVSDRVVTAIVAKAAADSQPPPPPVPPLPPMPGAAPVTTDQPSGIPDDPAAPHEAGIYIYNESAPAGSKMTMLDPSIYTQGKTGGVFASAMTYGIAKIKIKAVIRGAHSNTRISAENPTFYFYFEQHGAGLSYGSSFGGTSTPNEYTLLKFDVKGQTRETLTGSANAFGSSGGTDDKAVTGFTFTKLRPGAYKVVLNAPLQSGEYGFVVTAYSRVFDFGKD